ncbi:glycosyltransferase [Robertkochia marina]|uniref:Glycosyltransferase n=1 Tax=Robertkochia marina TaxID=1227945 RepID=A0A4S3LZC0_9FLAO|nr:glycosyltransferase [Robertkochia marina]THD66786.1 glycosyltransferase [Robertkochia marina]TRZ41923.1 glycosyltransferase [Robertkochia marina]
MANKKKLLFFIENLSGGGAEKVLLDLVSQLDHNKFDIMVYSFVGIGVYIPQIKDIARYRAILPTPPSNSTLRIILFKIKYKLLRLLPASWVYKSIIKEKFDTEIAFIEGYCTKIIAASNNRRSKKIAWVHADLSQNHYTKNNFKSLESEIETYNKFDKIICVSGTVKSSFIKRFGNLPSLMVKYNPIDPKNIINKSKRLDQLKFQKSTPNIKRFIAIGRLEPVKAFDRLIDIAQRLKKDGFQFKIYILGDGSQRTDLEDLIKVYNVSAEVELLGFKANPYPYIKMADAMLVSSRSEGYSTVVAEALILGTPVITTDCSGMKELLGANKFGIITENSTYSLYAGIREYLNDPATQSKLSRNYKKMGPDFNQFKLVKSIEQVF